MQRVAVVMSLVLLIVLSLAAGVLLGDWPFWRRAAAWQAAWPAEPVVLPGSRLALEGGGLEPLPIDRALQPAVAQLAHTQPTVALLTWRADHGAAGWQASGSDRGPEPAVIAGELTALWLLPLIDHLATAGNLSPAVLDQPVSGLLAEWRHDARGHITPRQLAQHRSGLAAPRHRPLDPLSARARLAAGPDAPRAALATRLDGLPGLQWRAAPANSQLLALWLERHADRPLGTLLADTLWRPWRLGPAEFALDRPRGTPLMHCCLRAQPADWLALARWLSARPVETLPVLLWPLQSVDTASGPLVWAASRRLLLLARPTQGDAAIWVLAEEVADTEAPKLREALQRLLGQRADL